MGKKEESAGLKRIDDLFNRQQNYHSEWAMYELYYRGKFSDKQWKKLKKMKRSRIFIPVTRNVINIIRSILTTSFFGSGCPIEVSYVGESDRDKANVITAITKYWYDQTKPYKEISRAFWSALTLRMGITLTYWDNNKIVTQEVFIKDIAFDYEANNIDDVQDFAYRIWESGNTIKGKIKSRFYNLITLQDIFGNSPDDQMSRRFETKELIRRSGDKWEVLTYVNKKLARKALFERNPFQYGYAIDEYRHQNYDLRKNQILAYGTSMVELIRPIQDEINLKRNQKNDIQEMQINPSWIIDTTTLSINPFDLKKGPGTSIKANGPITPSSLHMIPTPSQVDLNNDLMMLTKQDLEDSSGVNGIMRGGTSASDRRSAAALSIVNANSSPRIEDMIMLMNDTHFHHWAKQFVHLAIKHTSDELIHKITERDDFPIGKMGERNVGDFDIRINFGSTINKEAKVRDLMDITQMLLQNPRANPDYVDRLFKEIITMKLGENTNLNEVLKEVSTMEQSNEADEPVGEEAIDPNEQREMMLAATGAI